MGEQSSLGSGVSASVRSWGVAVDEYLRAIQALVSNFLASTPVRLWLAFLTIGLVIEVFIKAARGQSARDILLNMRYGAVYLAVLFLLSPSANAALVAVASPLGIGWIDLDIFSTGTILGQIGAALAFVFILDHFYFWWHRAQHAVPWLGDLHAVHHSDMALNVSTNMRHHWTESIFQSFVAGLPMMVIFKLTPVSMWAISAVVSACTWFIHMNICLHLGRLAWIMAGPQYHRIHHSRLPEHVDKNFVAYMPIWDLLFGTYFAPVRNEYPLNLGAR